jgi:hypothetical protein
MVTNDIRILDRHKKNITCDLCRKTIWFFQKAIRCVVRSKDNIWAEYYHIKCLEKRGILRRLEKKRAGKWDDDDDKGNTTNLVV